MKMVMIAYNVALDGEILELLEDTGVKSYTKWPKVLGKGKASDPHLGTQVWPGINSVIMVAADDDRIAPLLNGVRKLRQRLGKEGIKAFVLPLEEMT